MNIIDNKIPTAVPSETFTGEIGYRYNTGSNEKLATVSTNTVLSPNVVLHAEGKGYTRQQAITTRQATPCTVFKT